MNKANLFLARAIQNYKMSLVRLPDSNTEKQKNIKFLQNPDPIPDYLATNRILLTGLGFYHIESLMTLAEDIKPHYRFSASGISWVGFGGLAYLAGGFYGNPRNFRKDMVFSLFTEATEVGMLTFKLFQNEQLCGIFAGVTVGFGVGKIGDTGEFEYLDW